MLKNEIAVLYRGVAVAPVVDGNAGLGSPGAAGHGEVGIADVVGYGIIGGNIVLRDRCIRHEYVGAAENGVGITRLLLHVVDIFDILNGGIEKIVAGCESGH